MLILASLVDEDMAVAVPAPVYSFPFFVAAPVNTLYKKYGTITSLCDKSSRGTL